MDSVPIFDDIDLIMIDNTLVLINILLVDLPDFI